MILVMFVLVQTQLSYVLQLVRPLIGDVCFHVIQDNVTKCLVSCVCVAI